MNFKSKLPYVTSHIFSYMSGLANEYKAINLSQGFPNFQPSQELQDLVDKCLKDKSLPFVNQYAPMAGLSILRERIAEKVHSCYGVNVNPETEITIGVGATEMIFDTIAALVWPGDEVIIIEPCYDCYRPAIDLVGGKPVIYKMKPPEFNIVWNDFARLITDKTKMICISTPNNPTGSVLTKEDMLRLIELVRGTNIFIMSDEVYEHMVFDGETHESPLKYPELRERTFSIFSFGKTYHITGWKVGYCIAPKELTIELRKVHQNTVYCVTHPLQKAIALYMEKSNDYLELSQFYQEKRNLFLKATKESKFIPLPCKGSYFQLFDYSGISNENDFDFCERLIKEYGVAAIPVSRMYSDQQDDKLIRLCFAKTDDVLITAGDIINKI